MEQIIYLEPTDDILTIRDRVDMANANRLLLVTPPYSDLFTRRVDLQLIQRRAAQCGVDLAIVTEDRLIQSMAREIGLQVFDSIERGKRTRRWRSHYKDEPAWKRRRNEEAWKAARQRGPAQLLSWRLRGVRTALAWMLLLAVMAVFVAAFVLIVPSGHIVLVPRNQPVTIKLTAAIDPSIRAVDYAQSRIPAAAVAVEVEGNAQVVTSGQKDIPSSNARGRVIFLNQLGQPVNVQKGTVVRTSAFDRPIRFVTTADVSVPGGFGAQATAPIEAVDAGVAGNVRANLINEVEGVAALAVRVTNPDPTSGGGVKQVSSVTQADKDRLRVVVLQQLTQRAIAQLQGRLGEQDYILPESVAVTEVLDETYDRFVGEESPALSLQMRVRVEGLKVGMQDANALVYAAMAAQVPAGYELISEGLLFQRQETLVPADKRGTLSFVMRGSGYAAARIDMGTVLKTVSGKPLDDARVRLLQALPLQADPVVEVSPGWFGRLPFLSFRTRIEIKPQA